MNLKDVLRKGDPAADDPGLSQEEIQAMRRTVLTAVPEPRRRGWLVPVAAAAVLILAVLVGLSLWRQPAPPSQVASKGRVEVPSPAQRGRVGEGSSSPAPKRPLPFPPPRQGAGEGASRPTPDVKVVRVHPGRRRPLHRNGGEGRGEGGRDQIALAETHQIQFSTPGGTRVIWVLHPAGSEQGDTR
ncbi:MAG TPA: hypothetical protein VH394_02530 [Thermoanaerobaculia bacterium]|jgi:hypothetical protein|nr:hypothetical protein [Thermoanaerobaculia bacterium]